MAGVGSILRKRIWPLLIVSLLFSTPSCGQAATEVKVPPTPTLFLTPTTTLTPTPTATDTPTSTPTRGPLTLLFYGDSVLKVGEANQPASVGFSFVDPLKASLPPSDPVIVSNHGGRGARWGYENLQAYVLAFHPDLVTLWWGLNDLGGCTEIFDPRTNGLIQYKLTAYINEHTSYMKKQIDTLLSQNVTVFVMTSIPVLEHLPWSHFTPDHQLVWETGHYCDFNIALKQLAQAQRILVQIYTIGHQPVYLVDAWQVYEDNQNAGKMYMDVVHPASHGAELIAAEWLRVFQSIETP